MKMTGFASPSGDKAFFFVGASYVRYDVAGDQADADYPRRIVDFWPGLFDRDIDACVPWNDGTVLFFKGDQYSRYDWAADRVADGYPRAIADDFPGLFASGVDAGVLLSSGFAYFFSGTAYQSWDTSTNTLGSGELSIADGWSGLFDSGIEAAVLWPTGNLYFLRGDEYSKYDLAADAVAAGYPASVSTDWRGLPFADTASPPSPVVPVGDTRPARQLTPTEAFAELDRLMAAGLVLHARSAMAGKVDLDGWNPTTGAKENGNVAGCVVRYLESGTKTKGTPTGGNAPDRLDPRHALAFIRLCDWLHTTYGVTEIYHLGMSADDSGVRVDCHGQGRALDFVGVKGTLSDTEYMLTVSDDWGHAATPNTPGGIWQPVGTDATHFRLDDAPDKAFERDFFRAVYEFVAGQWQDKTSTPDPLTTISTIGASSFIMNPDHHSSAPGTPHGREAHQDHLHMQIGVTGTA